jgi:HPr kinase/phosphorylase
VAGPPQDRDILHATAVADAAGRGLLILGPSGSGKSALALQMIALGARLIADDRTVVTVEGEAVMLSCPPTIRGMIEARGVGLLRVDAIRRAWLHLAVDLGATEEDRLPPHREIVILGRKVRLVRGPVTPHFPASLLLTLAMGRRE